MKNTKVIAAFPATGKTTLFNSGQLDCLDSDSSKFSWAEKGVRDINFPDNYIKHIKENIGKVDYIFVSTHNIVRRALEREKIEFYLYYPSGALKAEYIERFKARGNDNNFIEMTMNHWSDFVKDCKSQEGCIRIEMKEGEYLSNYI